MPTHPLIHLASPKQPVLEVREHQERQTALIIFDLKVYDGLLTQEKTQIRAARLRHQIPRAPATRHPHRTLQGLVARVLATRALHRAVQTVAAAQTAEHRALVLVKETPDGTREGEAATSGSFLSLLITTVTEGRQVRAAVVVVDQGSSSAFTIRMTKSPSRFRPCLLLEGH